MEHDIDKIRKSPRLSGQIGENAIWDGPLDISSFPKMPGSSSGKYGMEVSKMHCGCDSLKEPITCRAMGRGKMVR